MKIKVLLLIFICLFSTDAIAQNYEKSFEVGRTIGLGDINNSYLDILMINGFRLSKSFYLGMGTGFSYGYISIKSSEYKIINSNSKLKLSIPLFVRLKLDLHKKNKLTPFIAGNLGYAYYPKEEYGCQNDIMIEPDYGIEYKMHDYLTLYGILGLHMSHLYYFRSLNDWDFREVSTIAYGITIKGGIKF